LPEGEGCCTRKIDLCSFCDAAAMIPGAQAIAIRCTTKGTERESNLMEPNDSAFEELLAKYQGKVVRLCYAMLSNRALAEETAQEVFLRIWRGLGSFRGESTSSTWVYAITRNACLTARGRIAANATVSLDDPEILRRAHAHQLGQSKREPRTDVLGWLYELPEQQRQALTLFYLEEKSYEEVAAALDAPMGTIKTWIHRGRRTLAEKRLQWEAAAKERSGR
jgi:RNA polymerase sigma-70 factor (ECF subfamily)